MLEEAPDGDLATWLELHGPLTPVDALVLLNQICAELEQRAATGVTDHRVVPALVGLRSEEDGLVPILLDVSPPADGGERVPGLDALLWTMLSGVPAPATGLPRLGGNDELSAGFNTLLDLLDANGSRTAGMREIRSALVRLANRARSVQSFTPVPISAQESVRTEPRATPERSAVPATPLPEPATGSRPRTKALLTAAGLLLLGVVGAVGVVALLSR